MRNDTRAVRVAVSTYAFAHLAVSRLLLRECRAREATTATTVARGDLQRVAREERAERREREEEARGRQRDEQAERDRFERQSPAAVLRRRS